MEANLPANEKPRLAALASYRILDTLPEQTYDDLTLLASSICDTPMALITFIDQDRQWFKARVGVDAAEVPRRDAFCAHTILQPQEMLVVPDARLDPRFADNPFVQSETSIRFYAGAPLVTPEGFALGTICVVDNVSRQLTEQQERSLQALARQVMVHLELRRSLVEREQAEEANHFLASIVESSEDAILTVNFERVITSWNKAAERLYGYSAEEVIGRPLTLLSLPQDLQQVLGNIDRIKHSRTMETFDTIRVNKDGQELNLEVALSPVKDAAGKVIGVSSVARDITQRKQAEDSLRESNARFSGAFEYAPIGVALVSLEGGWLQVNQALCDVLGYSEAELLTRTFQEITHRDDLETDLENVDRLLAGEIRSYQMEKRYYHARGDLVTVLLSGSVVRSDEGQPLYFIAQIQDITERKKTEDALRESEAEFRALVEALPQIVWVTRPDGWHIHFNQGWMDYTGLSLEESLGFGWNPPFHPEDRDRAARRWQQATDSGEPYEIEYRLRRADGVYRWMLGRALPMRDANGAIVKWFGTCTDIHDLKMAEERLRASEERLRAFMDNTPARVFMKDREGRYIYLNRALEQAQGLPLSELLGQTDYQCYSLDIAEPLRRNDLQVFASGQAQQFEETTISSQGRLHHQIVAKFLLPSATGEQLLAGVAVDVTEQKQAEAERDRFFTLSLDMLAIAGSDGYFKRLNPAFEATLGFPNAEMMGTPLMEFVHPEDQQAMRQATQALIDGGSVQRFENRFRCCDGSYRWLCWTISSFEGLWYCVAHDVTQVKAAEATLLKANDELELHVMERTAQLQASNQALLDNEARLLRGNEIFTDLTRLRVTSQTELQEALQEVTLAGSTLLDVERCSVWLFGDGHSAITCLDLFQRSLQKHSSGNVLLSKEYPAYFRHLGTRAVIVADDAHTHPATCDFSAGYLTPLGITSMLEAPIVVAGEMVGVVCCEHVGGARRWQVEDQTFAAAIASICALALESVERARAEALLRQAKEEAETAYEAAEAANAAKSEFLSRMSHELRTPMNAILGFGQILNLQELSPLQQESVGHILKGGRHLLGLINEVLDISRVEAGSAELHIESVGLEEVANEACALVTTLAAQHNVSITLDLLAVRGASAVADRQRLRQVLINLLSNAVKYNHPNGRVVISAQSIEGRRLWVSIKDTGHGLSPQEIQKLFTPFERLHATHSAVEGTGLGLVISKRLITAMGGTLGVESEVGKGSTFWIELPQAQAAGGPLGESQGLEGELGPIQRGPTNPGKSRTFTVLSIEDNLSNMRLMEALLEDRPAITLLTAMQGSIGLDMARLHHPDVILLDLHLPDMTGRDVLEQLQRFEETKKIPVIVVSADATAKQIERLLATGAAAYLTKPLDVAAFLKTLDETLRVCARME